MNARLSTDRFFKTIEQVCARGPGNEDINWSENVNPPVCARDFAYEYIWVVLNSGMKNSVAEKINVKVRRAIADGVPVFSVFKHPGKSAAIQEIWDRRQHYFLKFVACDDVLEWCLSLPWIGPITKYHLAKNLGLDVAKPDRWLVRVAADNNETVDDLCKRLADATGYRVATVDLIIWRACVLGILTPETTP